MKNLYFRDKLKQGGPYQNKKIVFDKNPLIKDRKLKIFKQKLFD